MYRVRLQPTLVAGALEAVDFRQSESTVHQVCAALEVSRGLVLLGSSPGPRRVAEAIAEVAKEAGLARGLLRLSEPTHVETAISRVQQGDWLLIDEPSVDVLDAFLEALGTVIDIHEHQRIDHRRSQVLLGTWRAIVTYEPTIERRLPPIPQEHRRFFPLVHVRQ